MTDDEKDYYVEALVNELDILRRLYVSKCEELARVQRTLEIERLQWREALKNAKEKPHETK